MSTALPPDLTLRPATMEDAAILLSWRNDPATIASSRDQRPIPLADHLKWLEAVIKSTNRRLYIAAMGNQPVGTVRVDEGDDGAELSWTVAPQYRGKGYGKQMVRAVTALQHKRYWAETRLDNAASIRLVQSLGFERGATRAGMVRWHLDKAAGPA